MEWRAAHRATAPAVVRFKLDGRFDLNLLDPLALIDGTLVCSLGSDVLMAVGLDLRAKRTIGDPVTLGPTTLTRISGASEAAMSPSGTLVYQAADPDAVLGWVEARDQFRCSSSRRHTRTRASRPMGGASP